MTDYFEDEIEFKDVRSSDIKGSYILDLDGNLIFGDVNYIIGCINDENLKVQSVEKNVLSVNLVIHDDHDFSDIVLNPIERNQHEEMAMGLLAKQTTYQFTCDEGKILDREVVLRILSDNSPIISDDGNSVDFTVKNDNDTSKVNKIKGALWYSQKEQ